MLNPDEGWVSIRERQSKIISQSPRKALANSSSTAVVSRSPDTDGQYESGSERATASGSKPWSDREQLAEAYLAGADCAVKGIAVLQAAINRFLRETNDNPKPSSGPATRRHHQKGPRQETRC